MRRDGLRLAGTLEEEQLGKDGDSLEEDGEGPQKLGDREPVVEEECEDDLDVGGGHEALHNVAADAG